MFSKAFIMLAFAPRSAPQFVYPVQGVLCPASPAEASPGPNAAHFLPCLAYESLINGSHQETCLF